MKKKVLIIVCIILFISLIASVIIMNLIKDFGIENLDKSTIAFLKIKMGADTEYIEIEDNVYIVKNKKAASKVNYNYKTVEKSNNLPTRTVFKFCKDGSFYSIVKFDLADEYGLVRFE